VIDAKVSLSAYLESLEAETEAERRQLLETHARQVQAHIQKLAAKSYWAQFQPSPDFVVFFIPGENFSVQPFPTPRISLKGARG